ncbi:MAG: FAD-dependent oxidoreductase [Planctomycetota bacterium]|jgi:NADPH-dependent 2,4-dienoyl-CoA reductase/sulfur reductase-like enzyme/Pyruvate/2-oxoacid:ferredoxin oxidoreductase delta subunit
MSDRRVDEHPILPVSEEEPSVPFYWNGQRLAARPGEMISSALFASGVHTFGHHPRDGAPLGIFCANGQCAQCTVVANGVAVKSCMVPVAENMVVTSCDRVPALPPVSEDPQLGSTGVTETDVLVIGAGPAGLSAAIELGKLGVSVLVVDDKDRPGGKLVLQTHKFFGSIEDTSAGTRGIDIATNLFEEAAELPSVSIWLLTTAVGVFSDGRVGVVRGDRYHLVAPKALLIATGAREKQIPFPGHTMPGVYGAGAFQTLLNRDLVRPCERLFVLGGGNVGLIAAYHAVQADIEVVGLAEVLPKVGGYQVHADKIRRLGVPVFLSHTILAAHGEGQVEAVTIAQVDSNFKVVPGTEQTFEVDTILVAVGLAPLDDFLHQARDFGLMAYAAGDAAEIAEASAATFGGRIAAVRIARDLGLDVPDVPAEWEEKLEVLKARPGPSRELGELSRDLAVYPVIRCTQEIPCNPCVTVCKKDSIRIEGDPILGIPEFVGDECTACAKCVTICPGLAITMVDARKDPERPIVTVPFEQSREKVAPGSLVLATDHDGVPLGRFEIVDVKNRKFADRTLLVRIAATPETAPLIAGIRVQDPEDMLPVEPVGEGEVADEVIVCRCEHVTAGEIRQAIRDGTRDVNEMKAELRVCMGACCGKNCPEHITRIFREEGVEVEDVTPPTRRPLFVEVPFGIFASGSRES